jgi:S-adenosylmethionine:tRNA ribosyltransferase-isomerase
VKPASLPRDEPRALRLLAVDPAQDRYAHHTVADLPDLFREGDVLVVNDAATLPASLAVAGEPLEIRLVRRGSCDEKWTAITLGAGDVRTPTEKRGSPRAVREGEVLDFGGGLEATVTRVDPEHRRLVDLSFHLVGSALFSALYRRARPIQYAYLERELALFHFQNRFAGRPWALELPSAGHCLTWDLLGRLRARGVSLAHLTHAAGISSTGSAELDRLLPLPERYEIPASTLRAIETAKARGGRVVAAGTTVVRALESCQRQHGRLTSGEGEARLVLGPGFRPRIVDGILTGMHEPETSHFALLRAFAPARLLERALAAAEQAEYLQHEFGDTMLILASNTLSDSRRPIDHRSGHTEAQAPDRPGGTR